MDGPHQTAWPRPRKLVLVLFAAVLLCGTLAVSAGVHAQGLVLSTPYPGVVARPGETLTFPLHLSVRGLGDQKVTLQVTGQPKGWEVFLLGDGRQVYQVYVPAEKGQEVELQVKVPEDAQPGEGRIVVSARSAAGSTALQVSIRVSTEEAGPDRMVTQYPSLTGPSNATFRFRVDLTNNGSRERSYSLRAQAPPGWQVTFSPAYENKQIASLSLGAGETRGLDVEVKPPQKVAAGRYNIVVEALSGASQASASLEVNIVGTFELRLSTPSGRLSAEANPGRESPVKLVVENAGSADLGPVTFSSSPPRNWSVRFDPETIDTLAAGESREITAYIKPDSRAIAGDYLVSISASARGAWESAQFRVTVLTPTAWGMVGIALVAAVMAGVWATFRKYGRR
ncbi:MAG: NEW3 domain-containing protein [Bacillota bacterium]